ncbi:MAG: hypothetical protein IJ996_00190 [Clostridia bacterium]|nr:hypothetical protein [Clostridia bacterium]
MKKLSGIIAAAVCVTIGGVYATWTFADNNDIARVQTGLTVGLTEIQTSGTAAGTYTFKDNTLSIVVDQTDTGNHTAKLIIDGSVTIVFTPNANAGNAVTEGAIKTIYRVEPSVALTSWTYDDDSDDEGAKQIFTVNSENQIIDGVVGVSATAKSWTKETSGELTGSFTYVLTGAELASLIGINNFVIESKAEHESFDGALTKGQFILYVNDFTTASGTN